MEITVITTLTHVHSVSISICDEWERERDEWERDFVLWSLGGVGFILLYPRNRLWLVGRERLSLCLTVSKQIWWQHLLLIASFVLPKNKCESFSSTLKHTRCYYNISRTWGYLLVTSYGWDPKTPTPRDIPAWLLEFGILVSINLSNHILLGGPINAHTRLEWVRILLLVKRQRASVLENKNFGIYPLLGFWLVVLLEISFLWCWGVIYFSCQKLLIIGLLSFFY